MVYLTDIIRRLRQIARRAEGIEEGATKAADDLEILGETTAGRLVGSFPKRGGRRDGRGAKEEEVAKRLADRGVSEVVIAPHTDGSSCAEIEGITLPLPEKLARFLTVICMRPGEEEGHLIEWKSWDDVAVLMGKKPGKAGRHAVSQLVYRLRDLLRECGGNPYWVQTNRTRGVRFALRSKGSVIEGDEA